MSEFKKDEVYGEWTVMSNNPVRKKGKKYIKVKCKCGLEKEVYYYYLKNNKSSMCAKCSAKLRYLTNDNFKSFIGKGKFIGDLGATLYNNYRIKAETRNLEFNISQQELWDLLVIQNFECALTGQKIHLSTKCRNGNPKWDEITASPDRIDSSKGYCIGNIQWVHKQVNLLKNRFDNDWFIEICKMVASKHDNPELSLNGN